MEKLYRYSSKTFLKMADGGMHPPHSPVDPPLVMCAEVAIIKGIQNIYDNSVGTFLGEALVMLPNK